MSTNRVSRGGWVNEKALPKGPNGRNLCRRCNAEVPKGRRTFCSQECVHHWSMRTNPGYVRQQVYQRDKGVCALCGLDTEQWAKDRRREWVALKGGHSFEEQAARQRFRAAYPHWFGRVSHWDADHIVPVVEGGGECDLDNYRTLCIPCHKHVTAELATRRAAARRPEREARRAQETEQQRIAREVAIGKVRLF